MHPHQATVRTNFNCDWSSQVEHYCACEGRGVEKAIVHHRGYFNKINFKGLLNGIIKTYWTIKDVKKY